MDDWSKVGLPPGTPIHTGDKQLSRVKIRIVDYSPSKLEVREDVDSKDCVPLAEGEGIRWVADSCSKLGQYWTFSNTTLYTKVMKLVLEVE